MWAMSNADWHLDQHEPALGDLVSAWCRAVRHRVAELRAPDVSNISTAIGRLDDRWRPDFVVEFYRAVLHDDALLNSLDIRTLNNLLYGLSRAHRKGLTSVGPATRKRLELCVTRLLEQHPEAAPYLQQQQLWRQRRMAELQAQAHGQGQGQAQAQAGGEAGEGPAGAQQQQQQQQQGLEGQRRRQQQGGPGNEDQEDDIPGRGDRAPRHSRQQQQGQQQPHQQDLLSRRHPGLNGTHGSGGHRAASGRGAAVGLGQGPGPGSGAGAPPNPDLALPASPAALPGGSRAGVVALAPWRAAQLLVNCHKLGVRLSTPAYAALMKLVAPAYTAEAPAQQAQAAQQQLVQVQGQPQQQAVNGDGATAVNRGDFSALSAEGSGAGSTAAPSCGSTPSSASSSSPQQPASQHHPHSYPHPQLPPQQQPQQQQPALLPRQGGPLDRWTFSYLTALVDAHRRVRPSLRPDLAPLYGYVEGRLGEATTSQLAMLAHAFAEMGYPPRPAFWGILFVRYMGAGGAAAAGGPGGTASAGPGSPFSSMGSMDGGAECGAAEAGALEEPVRVVVGTAARMQAQSGASVGDRALDSIDHDGALADAAVGAPASAAATGSAAVRASSPTRARHRAAARPAAEPAHSGTVAAPAAQEGSLDAQLLGTSALPATTAATTTAAADAAAASQLPVVQRPVRPTPPRRHPNQQQQTQLQQQQQQQQPRGDAGCWPQQHPALTEPPPPPPALPVPAASAALAAACAPSPSPAAAAPANDDLSHPRTLHFVCWQAAKSGILPPRGFLRLYVERVPAWLRRRASDVELAQAVETLQLLRWVPRQELGEALGAALERRAPASKLPLRRMGRWLRKQQQLQGRE
ncbi:hypothetical protein HYH02_005698 [Chlamydomonas schloesseri]|uniref:Uncharacterized protein n=1 Tax=Chlamydomonas schloesseri TaxID=2026947 RepID=A0A836B6H3_9CHLO|nr:hypothetical protein HYH02_005698 [Chlamydomonas schloesseri]|eukprot:KAG2448940.1 hypothetical protein HYH02_005698 [Chlamydomonas schloesseri]